MGFRSWFRDVARYEADDACCKAEYRLRIKIGALESEIGRLRQELVRVADETTIRLPSNADFNTDGRSVPVAELLRDLCRHLGLRPEYKAGHVELTEVPK